VLLEELETELLKVELEEVEGVAWWAEPGVCPKIS